MIKGNELYNSILNGIVEFESLNENEVYILFDYLCSELEKGNEIDKALLNKTEAEITAHVAVKPDIIIEKTYNKLNILSNGTVTHFKRKLIFRRLLIAAVSVLTFAVFCFGTASAFGIDIVESFKTIVTDNSEKYNILYEETTSPGKRNTERYKSLEELFKKELDGYLFPTELPEGIEPKKVSVNKNDDELFVLTLNDANGSKQWQITAKSAEDAYIPLGYKYSVGDGENKIEYVYSISRNDNVITRYTVFCVYDNVFYTFHLYTSEWEEAKIILNSMLP